MLGLGAHMGIMVSYGPRGRETSETESIREIEKEGERDILTYLEEVWADIWVEWSFTDQRGRVRDTEREIKY